MRLEENKFKKEFINRNKARFGLWLGLTDATAVEIVANVGFDWLLIDDEHAPFEVSDIVRCLQILAAYDCAPIVRSRSHDTAHLKKLLDIGVQNFLVPMVDNALQAEAVIEALYFPPRGKRGLGTSLARAAKWNRITDYIHRANDEICFIAQTETIEAIDNLEAILKITEVDGIFIGPSDLAASMGYPGEPGRAEVVDMVKGAIDKIIAAGKPAGVLAVDATLAAQYQAQGATFIGVGTDTSLLSKATQELAKQFIFFESDVNQVDY